MSSFITQLENAAKGVGNTLNTGLGEATTLLLGQGGINPYGNKYPGFNQLIAGGSKGGGNTANSQPANWSPQDQISQFLSQYNTGGASTDQVYNFLKSQYGGNVQNQQKLTTALQNFASDAGWTPLAAGNTNQNVIYPQAMQQFFQQTIAPYLQQLGQNSASLSQQINSQPVYGNLPPQYAAVVQQGRQNMAQDTQALSNATMAAGLEQPQIDAISTMLSNVQKAQLQDYYRMLNTSTLTGQASSYTNLGSNPKSNPNA